MKKFLALALVLMLAFSLAACTGDGGDSPGETSTPNGEDPCACCPDCNQEDCVCAECGGSEACKCAAPDSEANWTITFENAMASSPNKNLPDYFIENYTLNFTATKQGGYTMLGAYTGTGYLTNEMDPSGAYEVSGGRLLYDEMGWEGPLADTSFELYKPEDIAAPADDLGDLTLLAVPFGASAKEPMSWSVTGRHYVVSTDGSGVKDMEAIYEPTYRIVVYSDGTAELYLYDTTASSVLCFRGTISKKPIGSS
ncbi:MAG: hypothetical protein FWF10_00825 [Clostridiales bacterium]|nr:hypothetical protein [Clostridiales bacterium]